MISSAASTAALKIGLLLLEHRLKKTATTKYKLSKLKEETDEAIQDVKNNDFWAATRLLNERFNRVRTGNRISKGLGKNKAK